MRLPTELSQTEAPTQIRICPNCGEAAEGRFCARCGQRQATRLVSVRRMLADFVDDQLSVNGKFPRTLAVLLLRPGLLTCEYVAGRIARYLTPFRLYLVSSVIFFVVVSWKADVAHLIDEVEKAEQAPPDTAAVASGDAAPDSPSPEEMKRMRINLGVADTTRVPGWLRPVARRMERQEERLNAMSKASLFRLLADNVERHLPKAMFLMVPAFALILKLLYLRRRRLYVEHFVFALHVHAFTFLIFTLMLVVPGSASTPLLMLWLVVYYFWAMKRVYEQSWPKTAVKYFVLFQAYLFVLSFVLVGAFMLAVLTI